MFYLPPVVEYVRELARGMGFDNREVHFIHLAVEEAVSNVIRHGFQENPEGAFEIVCEQAASGLTLRIREKGIPFDVSKFADYSADRAFSGETPVGLGSYLIKRAMDEVSFRNLGKAGKEIRLTKYLGGAHTEVPLPEGAEESAGADAASKPGERRPRPRFSVRAFDPADAVEVSRCAYRTYGYAYDDFIYYPERILEHVRSGELFSAVAVTEDGEIVGHAAMKKERAEDVVAELGCFFISPEFRGSTVFMRLCGFLKEHVPAFGLQGLFTRSVATHTITQRGAALFGFKDCGLCVGGPRLKAEFADFSGTPRPYTTMVLAYLPMKEERRRVIHPPEALRERVLGLYGQLGIPVETGGGGDCAGGEIPRETECASTLLASRNMAGIVVSKAGEDAVEVVRRHFHHQRRAGAAAIHLQLDLEDPVAAPLASAMLQEGFLFGGILPYGLNGRDALILQYLNTLKVEYDQIELASQEAKDLLAYIRENDPGA